MPVSVINGVRLYSEWCGESGASVVLVHGSWGDHHNWDAVVPKLARTFQVLTYDRRGHSQSQRLVTQGSVEEDVADLAALITATNLVPVHVVGTSFGALIALKLAAARPDLFASLMVHEPPLIGLLDNNPALPSVEQRIGAVLQRFDRARQSWGRSSLLKPLDLVPACGSGFRPRCGRHLCSTHRRGSMR